MQVILNGLLPRCVLIVITCIAVYIRRAYERGVKWGKRLSSVRYTTNKTASILYLRWWFVTIFCSSNTSFNPVSSIPAFTSNAGYQSVFPSLTVEMPSELGYRLPEDAAPMKLCLVCAQLNTKVLASFEWNTGNPFGHQPSFTALKSSALSGCEMCCMFLEDSTQAVCDIRGCSESEVHQAFRDAESKKEKPATCLIISRVGKSIKRGLPCLTYITYRIPFMRSKSQWGIHSTYFILRNCCGELDIPRFIDCRGSNKTRV